MSYKKTIARLIDAEPILKRWNTESLGRKEMYDMVKNAPMVDAVPVVRCKDCRWWDKEREQCGITPSASPYGHCHDGETLEHSMIKDAGR